MRLPGVDYQLHLATIALRIFLSLSVFCPFPHAKPREGTASATMLRALVRLAVLACLLSFCSANDSSDESDHDGIAGAGGTSGPDGFYSPAGSLDSNPHVRGTSAEEDHGCGHAFCAGNVLPAVTQAVSVAFTLGVIFYDVDEHGVLIFRDGTGQKRLDPVVKRHVIFGDQYYARSQGTVLLIHLFILSQKTNLRIGSA